MNGPPFIYFFDWDKQIVENVDWRQMTYENSLQEKENCYVFVSNDDFGSWES